MDDKHKRMKGGLNLVDLELQNHTFLLKLLWNIEEKQDNLWVRWIHAFYLKHDSVMERVNKASDSSLFKAIMQQRSVVQQIEPVQTAMGQEFKGRQINHADSPDVTWHNLILHNKAMPRVVFVLQMLCHEKLPTRMRLHRWGMVSITNCVFCYHDEIIDHVFFECEIFNRLWKRVLAWMHIQHDPYDWQNVLKWILRNYNGKGWKADLYGTCRHGL